GSRSPRAPRAPRPTAYESSAEPLQTAEAARFAISRTGPLRVYGGNQPAPDSRYLHMSEVHAAFGALLQLVALPGKRDELLRVLGNYVNTLDGEPGTTLFAVATDPNDSDIVWVWEEFADGTAVRAH